VSDETFVDFDNNLNSAVTTLRRALGDSARSPSVIETIPKVGYRLIGRPTPAASSTSSASRRRRWSRSYEGAAILAIAAAGTAWSLRRLPVTDDAHGGAPAPSRSANREAQTQFERGMYLRGQFLATHRGPERLSSAVEAFDLAAALDPSFAAATAERADTLVEMSFAGAVGIRDGLTRAREAARDALARDGTQGVAQRAMGLASLVLDWDLEGSRLWLDRAQRTLGPDARTSLALATWFGAAGAGRDATAAAERAVELDPAALYVRADLALFYLAAGRNRDAADSARQVLSVAPDFAPVLAYAMLAHERLEQWNDAARAARALIRLSGAPAVDQARLARFEGRDAVAAFRRWDLSRTESLAAGKADDYALALALRNASLGRHDAALTWLERALAARNELLVFVRLFPELDSLRSDPRFEHVAAVVTGGGSA
jgi:tetratricopeptide (TPR) repeat protein